MSSMKHFSLRGMQRGSYEELPDAYHEPHKQRHRRGYRRCAACAILGGFLWLLLTSTRLLPPSWSVPWSTSTATTAQHSETIPTLLQIVDPVTLSYVYALDNPVYNSLAQATLHQDFALEDDEGILEYPSLRVELHAAAFESNQQRALTLSWTRGLDRDANPIVAGWDEDDDDSCLVVLQCNDNSEPPHCCGSGHTAAGPRHARAHVRANGRLQRHE